MKNITIHDIAETLGISASTVSRALKDHPKISLKTKEKIWAKAKEMGYAPNIPVYLKSEKKSNIFLVVPEFTKYYTDIIEGAQSYLNKKSVNLLVVSSQNDTSIEEKLVENMTSMDLDGAMIAVFDKNKNYAQLLDRYNIGNKTLFINDFESSGEVNKIIPDIFNGVYKAIKHLHSQGAKKIGLFTGESSNPLYSDIISAFYSAIQESGQVVDEELIYASNLKHEDISFGIDKLLNPTNKPDGLFVADQNIAQQIVSYMRSRGLQVPQDLLIVSFGNEQFGSFVSPTLSSVEVSGKEIGEKAARQLHKLLNDEENRTSIQVVETRLIIRGSSMRL